MLIALLFPLTLAAPPQAPPARPFPQHVTYASGTLRPNHRAQALQDDDVRALYDAWKARYVVAMGTEPDGHPRYRVRSGRGAQAQTVSEGMGFGMIAVALLAGHDPNAQTVFDGLWEFARDHRSAGDARLMDWWVNWNESPDGNGDSSAFDGDGDQAYALLLAAAQWGDAGRFDYRAEALQVLAGLLQSTVGPQSGLPLLGDWVGANGQPYNQWSPRGSDFMLNHFRAFYRATGDVSWRGVTKRCQGVVTGMQSSFSAATGLVPDFMVSQSGGGLPLQPAPPNFLEGPYDGDDYYNSCRTPWRLGTDALVSGNATSLAQARKIAQWIRGATGGNPAGVRAGYHLSGTPLPGSNYYTNAFGAPFAVAAMTDPGGQAFLNAGYDLVRGSDEDYYEDSIALLCLLVLSGNWWAP